MIQEWTWGACGPTRVDSISHGALAGGECDAPYSTLGMFVRPVRAKPSHRDRSAFTVEGGQPEFYPCSAQEYLRLSGKSQRSGAGGVYTRLGETGIPSLQKWCRDVSTRTRRSASGRFLNELRSYIEDVRSFMDNTLAGKASHRAKLQMWGDMIREDLLPRFEELVKDEVSGLQHAFRERIEEFCAEAAEKVCVYAIDCRLHLHIPSQADKEIVHVLDRLYSKPWPTVRASEYNAWSATG